MTIYCHNKNLKLLNRRALLKAIRFVLLNETLNLKPAPVLVEAGLLR